MGETETDPAVSQGLTPKPTRRDLPPTPIIDQPIPTHRRGQRSWDDNEPSSPRFSRCRFSTIHGEGATSRFSSGERDIPSGLSSVGQSYAVSPSHKFSEQGKASTPKANKRPLSLVTPEQPPLNNKEAIKLTMSESAKKKPKPRQKREPAKVKDSDDDATINDVTPHEGVFLDNYEHAGMGDFEMDGTRYTLDERTRNVVRYLRKRLNYKPADSTPLGCIRLNKRSERCQCSCVRLLSEKIQEDFEPFDHPDDDGNPPPGPGHNPARLAVKDEWHRQMGRVVKTLMKILENPASDSAAIIMCTEATPFKPPNTQAGQVRLLFPMGLVGNNVQLCINGIYEILGDRQKEKVVELFKHHLSPDLVKHRKYAEHTKNVDGRPPRHLGTSRFPEVEHKSVVVQLLGVEKKRNQVAFHLWVTMCKNVGRHVDTAPLGGVTAAGMWARAMESYEAFNHNDCINRPDPSGNSSEFFRLTVWSVLANRLHELTSTGALVIASKSVIDGVEAKKLWHGTAPRTWVGSKLINLAGKQLNIVDENGIDRVFSHCADAGSIDATGQERVLTMVRKAILATAGIDGSKEGSKLEKVGGDENTHYYSTKIPKPGSECLRDLLNHLSDNNPMGLYDLETEVEMQQDCDDFQQRLVNACVMLVPNQERAALLATGFTPLCGFGVLASWMNKKNYSGRLTCQVYHTDHKCVFYNLLRQHGIYAFVLTIPVSEEGCFIKVYDKGIGGTNGVFKPKEGKIAFIPYGSALAQPISSIHAGGIRTGFLGNPRMHGVVFLVPDAHLGTVTRGDFFPHDYTTSWLVEEPEGRKLEGSKSVKHPGKDTRRFGRSGQESREGLKGQFMKELNELLIALGC